VATKVLEQHVSGRQVHSHAIEIGQLADGSSKNKSVKSRQDSNASAAPLS
jgi:hypothetical protein